MDNTTNSLAFPYMFDIARNRVSTYTGNRSIVNRTRLLILSNPTELYNEPDFGVGLKRYLWQYNTPNTKAIIQARIKDQLQLHEPYVDATQTQFADGLAVTGDTQYSGTPMETNELKMSVGLQTIYKDDLTLTLDIEEERARLLNNTEE